MRIDDALRPLLDQAKQQDLVVSRRQLAAVGVDSDGIRNQVRARRWQTLGPRAVRLTTGRLDDRQRAWVAVLNCPGRLAAVAGVTALRMHGFSGPPDTTTHVVVPQGVRVRPQADVTVHHSSNLSSTDLHPHRLPPVTRIERSVIDAAAWAVSDRRCCGVLAAAVQQRLTTAERLLAELETRPQVRRHRLMRLTLGDVAGGAQSFAEIEIGVLCRRHGLPAPLLQQERVEATGRRRYLDATFPRSDGTTFGVEIDGALHLLPDTYWDDMSRGNELAIGGSRVLRFPSISLRLDAGRVIDQIRRMCG